MFLLLIFKIQQNAEFLTEPIAGIRGFTCIRTIAWNEHFNLAQTTTREHLQAEYLYY